MKLYRNYFFAFLLGLICLFGLSSAVQSISFFWTGIFWGCCVFGHQLYRISSLASDEWAIKRADKLVDSSYDLHHIENIRERRTARSRITLKNRID